MSEQPFPSISYRCDERDRGVFFRPTLLEDPSYRYFPFAAMAIIVIPAVLVLLFFAHRNPASPALLSEMPGVGVRGAIVCTLVFVAYRCWIYSRASTALLQVNGGEYMELRPEGLYVRGPMREWLTAWKDVTGASIAGDHLIIRLVPCDGAVRLVIPVPVRAFPSKGVAHTFLRQLDELRRREAPRAKVLGDLEPDAGEPVFVLRDNPGAEDTPNRSAGFSDLPLCLLAVGIIAIVAHEPRFKSLGMMHYIQLVGAVVVVMLMVSSLLHSLLAPRREAAGLEETIWVSREGIASQSLETGSWGRNFWAGIQEVKVDAAQVLVQGEGCLPVSIPRRCFEDVAQETAVLSAIHGWIAASRRAAAT